MKTIFLQLYHLCSFSGLNGFNPRFCDEPTGNTWRRNQVTLLYPVIQIKWQFLLITIGNYFPEGVRICERLIYIFLLKEIPVPVAKKVFASTTSWIKQITDLLNVFLLNGEVREPDSLLGGINISSTRRDDNFPLADMIVSHFS